MGPCHANLYYPGGGVHTKSVLICQSLNPRLVLIGIPLPHRNQNTPMAKGKRSKAIPAGTSTSTPTAAAVTLSWPQFKPELPVADLTPETVVPDKVVIYRSFFPRSLCRDYVSFLGELPLCTTPGKPQRGMALRVNDRYQIDDPRFAHRIWTETGLREALLDPDLAHLWYGMSSICSVLHTQV